MMIKWCIWASGRPILNPLRIYSANSIIALYPSLVQIQSVTSQNSFAIRPSQRPRRLRDLSQMVSIQRLEHLPEDLMTVVLLIPHILVVLDLAFTV